MTTVRTAVAGLAATALVAVPLTVAGTAHADTERSGGLPGGGRYELSVDREDGGLEISAGLDDVTPGSTWTIVLRQDGKRIARATLTADDEGDLDLDRYRADTRGTDRFVMTVKAVGSSTKARAALTR